MSCQNFFLKYMYYGIKREATVSMEKSKMLRVVFLGSFLFEAKIENQKLKVFYQTTIQDSCLILECSKLIPYDLSSFFYICSY